MSRRAEDRLTMLAGQWEITCEESNAVWGNAVVNSLCEGLLQKRSTESGDDQMEERIPCSFEASGAAVKLQWGRQGATMSASLVGHGSDWLRWRLKPHSNGNQRGCVVWKRKPAQPEGTLPAAPTSWQLAAGASEGTQKKSPLCSRAGETLKVSERFSQHNGFISAGGDIEVAEMTISEAMFRCLRIDDCQGFSHEGPPTDGLHWIYFKNKWEVGVSDTQQWTSYRKEEPLKKLEEEVHKSWQRAELRSSETRSCPSPPLTPDRSRSPANTPARKSSRPCCGSPLHFSLVPAAPLAPPNTPARRAPRPCSGSPTRGPATSLAPPCTPARKNPRPRSASPRRAAATPRAPPNTPARKILGHQSMSPSHASALPLASVSTPARKRPCARSPSPVRYSSACTPMKKCKAFPSPETEAEKSKAPSASAESDMMDLKLNDSLAQSASSSTGSSAKTYKVLEAFTRDHEEQVWNLHSQKAAFSKEHEQLKARVFDNEEAHCRSWLLAELDVASQQAHVSKASKESCAYLAAITVKLNPYMKRAGLAWAQVMNLSVSVERQGHGTRLVAAVEELLQREGVNVVVLYPVQNKRATKFWESMGFIEPRDSFLPAEEHDSRNGALLPEGTKVKGEITFLPRWEKMLKPNPSPFVLYEARWCMQLEDGTPHVIDTENESSWKQLKRQHWPLWRKTVAKSCKLDAEEVAQRFEAAQKERLQRRTL